MRCRTPLSHNLAHVIRVHGGTWSEKIMMRFSFSLSYGRTIQKTHDGQAGMRTHHRSSHPHYIVLSAACSATDSTFELHFTASAYLNLNVCTLYHRGAIMIIFLQIFFWRRHLRTWERTVRLYNIIVSVSINIL